MASLKDAVAKSGDDISHLRPELLVFCAIVALVTNLAPIVANVVATFVAEHDFIADTISDLARGPHKWIMDLGFYLNAAGMMALAVATAHAHLGRVLWSLSILALSLLALVIVMLGLWDDFGQTAPDRDMSIHTRLTFALGPLYLLGPLLMIPGAQRENTAYRWLFLASAALWIALAAAFKLSPTGYDGLLERLAVAATLLWTMPLAVLFLRYGLQARHESDPDAIIG